MKNKLVILGLSVVCIFCGCGGKFPEMTAQEEEMIGEYAAITLLKYDANSRSRLVDLTQIEIPETGEAPAESIPEPGPVEEPSVPDTPVIEIGEETSGPDSLESYFELAEGVTINYIGEEICQSYSMGETDYFSLEASPGKSLLVLSFQINNASGADQTIDMLSRKDTYRVTVNGNYNRTSLPTLLTNDMSTYRDTIASGGSATVVLIIEVDQEQAGAVSSISLNLKNESKTYTIQLL